jgi:hypothetical protein
MRGGKVKWIPGTIVAIKGPNSYLVRVPGNNRRFVHADHIIPDDSTVTVPLEYRSEELGPVPISDNNPMDTEIVMSPGSIPASPAQVLPPTPVKLPEPKSVGTKPTPPPSLGVKPKSVGTKPTLSPAPVVGTASGPTPVKSRAGRVIKPREILDM